MQIACLQFASDADNIVDNINRADEFISRESYRLDNVDLLVLPGMAFTAGIARHAEDSGSAHTVLWAQTTARKYRTNVLVGYAEKADATKHCPSSPEFCASAIMVYANGKVVRDRNEFMVLPGRDYPETEIWGMGKVCHPSELGAGLNHTLESEATVLAFCMSSFARKSPSFQHDVPYMETIGEWLKEVNDIIMHEGWRETIAICCNKWGEEGGILYTGSSSVFGFGAQGVAWYDWAASQTDHLLIVDTAQPPLLQITKPCAELQTVGETRSPIPRPREPSPMSRRRLSTTSLPSHEAGDDSPIKSPEPCYFQRYYLPRATPRGSHFTLEDVSSIRTEASPPRRVDTPIPPP